MVPQARCEREPSDPSAGRRLAERYVDHVRTPPPLELRPARLLKQALLRSSSRPRDPLVLVWAQGFASPQLLIAHTPWGH